MLHQFLLQKLDDPASLKLFLHHPL